MPQAYVIEPPVIPTLPVEGTDARFPVNRIFCVGRNYAEHAREMGHDPQKDPPFFFMKPSSAVVADGHDMRYPSSTEDLHHEVELVVALGRGGADISADDALALVFGYAVGLDMTRRDLQAAAKKLSRPWETAKAFDESAPCSTLVSAERIGHPDAGPIELKVNGEMRQHGDLKDMIWKVPDIIAYLSTLFELQPGDLIFTGTPAGVGAVQRGDRLDASVGSVAALSIAVR